MTWDEGAPSVRSDLLGQAHRRAGAAARPGRRAHVAPQRRRSVVAAPARRGLPPRDRPAAEDAPGSAGSASRAAWRSTPWRTAASATRRGSTSSTSRPRRATRAPPWEPRTYVWNQELRQPRGFVMRHAFTGPEYDDDARSPPRSSDAGLSAERLDDDALLPLLAERIAAGDVVGWFQGRMEFGPRALGHRSIVADPRRAETKESAQRAHEAPRVVPPVRSLDPRWRRRANGSSRTTHRRS